MRHIILMPEYESYPIWEEEDGGLENYTAHNLPIPRNVAEEIESWGLLYCSTYNANDPLSSRFKTKEEERCFIAKGHGFHKQLKLYLGKFFCVTYKDILGNSYE